MRHLIAHPIMVGFAALMLLAGCGGGGGESNNAPFANAGAAQSVVSGVIVTLNGSGSSDSDGSIASYAWSQTSGASVTLSSASAAQPTFTAPVVTVATPLVFSLTVTDDDGATASASVTVTINPVTAATVTLTGTVNFARAPFSTTVTSGLNYGSPTMQPARGVIVRVVDATTSTVLGTGATSDTGGYSFQLPGNTSVQVQVVARMQRSGALPIWDVRVQDGTSASGTPYSHSTAAFNSSVGTQNVDIPLGISPGGTATGTRASGPFAILDTIYSSIQFVLTAAPTTSFPTLYVNWGNGADGTYFTTANGQHLTLLNDLTDDTDEFDAHVVAHEFGHYIEYNFSRSDSIGGPHALGNRLDMRVAFGEGFGYAFAAMVMNDSVIRDSYVDGGQQLSGYFDAEANPPQPAGFNQGCWCSESSVWAILWDLYDNDTETNDTLALGFTPIWEVLVGAQKTTPAFTSIFSFVTALKSAQPTQAAAIDTLVAAQNINSAGIDIWGTNETNAPAALLPLYANVAVGAPTVVRTLNDYGTYNKAGNRRFLRYVPAASSVNVSLSTSNAHASNDPDFEFFRSGVRVDFGVDPPPGPEIEQITGMTPGTTYLFDIYDCANGCSEEQGSGSPSGDYDLTTVLTN